MLWDLAQSHHLAERSAPGHLDPGRAQSDPGGSGDRGVKQAPFVVLRGAAMPAVLVELGFLNDPEQEQRLADTAYRGELVEALVRAVTRFKAQVRGPRRERRRGRSVIASEIARRTARRLGPLAALALAATLTLAGCGGEETKLGEEAGAGRPSAGGGGRDDRQPLLPEHGGAPGARGERGGAHRRPGGEDPPGARGPPRRPRRAGPACRRSPKASG